MIIIKNLRNENPTQPWQVRIDRSSTLGNPYKMNNESERNEVCDAYQEMFDLWFEFPGNHQDKLHELKKLIQIYKQYKKLELFCWCAPKRCHAETIRNYILKETKQ